ncbi:GNAT family N-acetyltransferase [Nocardia salmonicida]|uniref:GNAT family N-acetyltransferase n=1 Tax=Nocardia salmonicida TaxID=53431 RepID=UPI003CE78703
MTVVVARARPTDIPELLAFWTVHAQTLTPNFLLPSDPAQWSASLRDSTTWWYTVREVGSLVAVITLARVTGPPWCSAEMGIGVAGTARGRGIGASSLRTLFATELSGQLRRIEALVDPLNTASARTVAAAGMRWEGVSRAPVRIGEVRPDLARWAIVADQPTEYRRPLTNEDRP